MEKTVFIRLKTLYQQLINITLTLLMITGIITIVYLFITEGGI